MEGICHDFGNLRAVDRVTLDVQPGEVVCLLGPSGCGKSTLLRIAASLEELQQGRVFINGEDMRSASGRLVPPEQRNVGLMFQDSALFPHLSVLDNVSFGLGRLAGAERRKRALELLETLGMAAYADRYPHMLSGGQQQRVALARALAPGPGLMLLDEPFSALDARLRDRIRDDTLHLLKKAGAGTLLVTHDPEEAMFMADRIALMKDGRVLQMDRPVDLYCRPKDPFVATFFGEVNRMEGVVHNGAVDTPLGQVEARELPEGTPVLVMVRPEAIRVVVVGQAHKGHRKSHVIMSRLLGRNSMVHICLHDRDNREFHMHSTMPGVFLPQENQQVELHLDQSQAFVFPLEAAND
ncbi:ABC transporter ATP-binding protein [Wenzhouxiangella sp. C33]|uniref:ABC transporter ATP-binding protein n=2 Tax=Wenzhouxiangella limi TaxID=2707351 RepID=A0A845VD38_9GAMM|nr:ABC transporter ATP-binding protein [Wenzhouxiangella limi]